MGRREKKCASLNPSRPCRLSEDSRLLPFLPFLEKDGYDPLFPARVRVCVRVCMRVYVRVCQGKSLVLAPSATTAIQGVPSALRDSTTTGKQIADGWSLLLKFENILPNIEAESALCMFTVRGKKACRVRDVFSYLMTVYPRGVAGRERTGTKKTLAPATHAFVSCRQSVQCHSGAESPRDRHPAQGPPR